MLASIPNKLFEEWLAYSELEPWDEVRADYRAASIVGALYHAFRKRGAPARPMEDFLLSFGEKREKTWQQLKALGQMIAQGFNAQAPQTNEDKEAERIRHEWLQSSSEH